jgi:hypothetical protein
MTGRGLILLPPHTVDVERNSLTIGGSETIDDLVIPFRYNIERNKASMMNP